MEGRRASECGWCLDRQAKQAKHGQNQASRSRQAGCKSLRGEWAWPQGDWIGWLGRREARKAAPARPCWFPASAARHWPLPKGCKAAGLPSWHSSGPTHGGASHLALINHIQAGGREVVPLGLLNLSLHNRQLQGVGGKERRRRKRCRSLAGRSLTGASRPARWTCGRCPSRRAAGPLASVGR